MWWHTSQENKVCSKIKVIIRLSPAKLGLGLVLGLAITLGPKYFPNVFRLYLIPLLVCLFESDSIFIPSRDVEGKVSKKSDNNARVKLHS